LTYIDNLISSGANTSKLQAVANKVGATFGSFEGHEMDIQDLPRFLQPTLLPRRAPGLEPV
jgi:hypothetical protein